MDTDPRLAPQELMAKIKALEYQIRMLREEKDQQELLNFPWIGNLGNWYWFLSENRVIHNIQKVLVLGYSREEIPDHIGFEFFTSKLHPEDYEPVMENMRTHLRGETPAYEVTYRIQAKNGDWKWFYDRGKITKWNEAGEPELVAGIVFDMTEQKKVEQLLLDQNKRLIEMTNTDHLTQVLSRKALFECLAYELQRLNRTHHRLSVLMIDVDHFKKINDTLGHLVGDRVLAEIAQILKTSLRKTDFVGRYGGEEFLIVLPECGLQDAASVADKLRETIAATEFPDGLRVTVSGGASEYFSGTLEKLVDVADQCLYQAKRNGRNQIVSCPSIEGGYPPLPG